MPKKVVTIPPPEKRLDSAQACERLHITRRHLYRLAAEGRITTYKVGGRNLYDADELDGLITVRRWTA